VRPSGTLPDFPENRQFPASSSSPQFAS
jgi:hypothetical protein